MSDARLLLAQRAKIFHEQQERRKAAALTSSSSSFSSSLSSSSFSSLFSSLRQGEDDSFSSLKQQRPPPSLDIASEKEEEEEKESHRERAEKEDREEKEEEKSDEPIAKRARFAPELLSPGLDLSVSSSLSSSSLSSSFVSPTSSSSPVISELSSSSSLSVDSSSSSSSDPLDDFMRDLDSTLNKQTKEEIKNESAMDIDSSSVASSSLSFFSSSSERFYGDDEGEIDEEELDSLARDDDLLFTSKAVKVKKKEIASVIHAELNYLSIRKDFWRESAEITAMSEEEIVEARHWKLENVKIKGKQCPRPFFEWKQCGLPAKLSLTLSAFQFAAPFPIQCQAIPALMSGRDVLACARTGSGKTLAFVLPLIRHALDQPLCEPSEGPIALILAPTRELSLQIYAEILNFSRSTSLRAACVSGGSAISEQISALKRGVELLIATPGRLIDLLSANNGRVLKLSRVSFVVLDEADRLFDLGFEPQISRILSLARPDKQVAMFSATFPYSVEKVAKKAMQNPLEIVCGARSVVGPNISQLIEVKQEDEKFLSLLSLLGRWYLTGSIIIFADKQELVDSLFQRLFVADYACLSLHGGMNQEDRDSCLSDFKAQLRTVLVASSVVARGLDVKECVLVVNYDVPTHYEDYVHRVGRTGRAGRPGTAVTFVRPDQGVHALDLIKALQLSQHDIPPPLQALVDAYLLVRKASSKNTFQPRLDGFHRGKGFRFDETEEAEHKESERLLRLSANPDADEELAALQEAAKAKEEAKAKASSSSAAAVALAKLVALVPSVPIDPLERQKAAMKAAALAAALSKIGKASNEEAAQAASEARDKMEKRAIEERGERAKALLLQIAARTNAASAPVAAAVPAAVSRVKVSISINDYPQAARWAVTKRGALDDILDQTGCSVISKGVFVPPTRPPMPDEEKLYLLIEGANEFECQRCKNEIQRKLDSVTVETQNRMTLTSSSSSSSRGSSRYTVPLAIKS